MARTKVAYDERAIQTLDALEHIRLRSGMYIGRLGDGARRQHALVLPLVDAPAQTPRIVCLRIEPVAPDRERAPLWPRPQVLPWPEPAPRPTRLRLLYRPANAVIS